MKRPALSLFLGILVFAWTALAVAQTGDKPAAPPPAAPGAATPEKPAAPAPEAPAAPAPAPPATTAAPEPPTPPVADKPAPPPAAKPPVPVMGKPGGIGQGQARFFDLKTVETLAGSVVKVENAPLGKRGKMDLTRLTLKTDKESIEVFLGPAPYVEAQPVKLAPGDQVEVKGSRQTTARGTFLNAMEVKKDGQVLKLRDERGNPLWQGTGLMRPGRKAQE